MISPDAYNAFAQSGKKSISSVSSTVGGVYLIAQSGGSNVKDKQDNFTFDYGIDNLKLSIIGPTSSGSAAAAIDVQFQIIEPYGFSFIDNLKKASAQLYGNTPTTTSSSSGPTNPGRGFFILGIRFYGYDAAGNVVSGSTIQQDGTALDPNSSGTQLFERYYDIMFKKIKTKLDGKATVYSIEAATVSTQTAFNTEYGTNKNPITITASTVDDALTQLMAAYSKESSVNSGSTSANSSTYSIAYSNTASTDIGAKSLISMSDLDKYKWTGSTATSTTNSNPSTELKNVSASNSKRKLTIPSGTPILSAISLIISQSSFVEDALKVVYTSALEPDTSTGGLKKVTNSTSNTLTWYICNPSLSNAKWNSAKKSWVYDITYTLGTYTTPALDAAYANPTAAYYGPYKSYEYWYTGKNKEILQYSQELDNLYYISVLGTDSDYQSDGNTTDTPKVVGTRPDAPKQGSAGLRTDAYNTVATSLTDPSGQASASIQIMGDPDYLGILDMNSSVSTGSETSVYNTFYGNDGYSINYLAGQTFIEIDFKEAVDYDMTGTGCLTINDSIQFWAPPTNTSSNTSSSSSALSYLVNKVDCVFQNGTFKQTLDCKINTFANNSSNSSSTSSGTTTGSTLSSSNTGLMLDGKTSSTGTSTSNDTTNISTGDD